ncbi:hypothetical protein M8J77_000612 [Diaphorina citri]|nr:hypothetical protein M8J77_000612 [Diaphorina citri]
MAATHAQTDHGLKDQGLSDRPNYVAEKAQDLDLSDCLTVRRWPDTLSTAENVTRLKNTKSPHRRAISSSYGEAEGLFTTFVGITAPLKSFIH